MTTFSLQISDTDMAALQEATDRFNIIEARRPDAPAPVDAMGFLAMQVQTIILDRFTQVKFDADQAAQIQAILANPAALQAATAALAEPVQSAKIVP